MRPITVGLLIFATLSGAACHTMRPLTLDELQNIRPAQVWVTRADQSVVVVAGPQVLNERLVGFVDGKYQVMPAADVTKVVMRKRSGGRTAALVAAGALGFAAMAAVLSAGDNYVNPCASQSSDCDPNAP
jgi:hypothetical protein